MEVTHTYLGIREQCNQVFLPQKSLSASHPLLLKLTVFEVIKSTEGAQHN